MNNYRLGIAILAALSVTVQPLAAQQSPYFRFQAGQNKGAPNPTNPDPDPGTNTGGSLAFQGSPSLPSGPEGTPVSVAFSASGGTPGYAMTLQNAPSGLSIAQTGASTWTVSGTLTPVGSYQQAAVVLSDSAGGLVTLPEPLTVTPGQQQPAQLSLNGDSLQSGPVGTRVRGYYTASGGRRPYAMALVAPPAGVSLASVTTDTWQASGQYGQPGTYDSALVKVTDADNNSQTFPIPVTVTANQPLAFTQEASFPPSFSANTLQRATHQVTGGLAPYYWSLTSAPQTVVASGTAPGSTDVVGMVPTPGTYSGLTLTVTDSAGATLSHVLDTFTVTDDGIQQLDVTGVTPPPENSKPGDSFVFFATVTGLSDPSKSADIKLVGGPSAQFGGYTYSPGDPASSYGALRLVPGDAGQTYDLAILFTDHDNPSRQALVPWGKTTVATVPAFQATKQFQGPITGVAGSTQFVYAHTKGGSRSANAFFNAPDAFAGSSASFANCSQLYCGYSDPTIQDGEDLVTFQFTMPPPGTYEGVGIWAQDANTNERVYFDPFTVVSTAPPPMAKVTDFPSPQTFQAQQYGNTYMSSSYARMKGGSANLNATAVAPGITDNMMGGYSLYANVYDCSVATYVCDGNGGQPDEKLVELYGYLPKSGTYQATVTVTDPASGQQLAFLPVTLVVTPVPLGNCQVAAVNSMSDKDTTTPNALTFSGGQAPYTVTSDVSSATFSAPTADNWGNYSSNATLTKGTQSGPINVTVKDAQNATCTATGTANSLNLAAGDPVGVTIQRQCPYGDCQYQTSFYAPQGSADNDIYATGDIASPYGTGPVGAHPDPKGLYLTFNAPGGASVTGYSVDTSSSPQGNLVLLNTYPYMDNVPWNVSDPTTSLFLAVYDDQRAQDFVMGTYTATYNVYLSDGTYRKSVPVTVHVPQFSPGG